MAYPKYHGITLANNSVIENLHLERLAADPVPATAGRLWVNTTEKKVKFTGLDETGAVVVHSIGSAAEVAASLAEAKAYTDSAFTSLKGIAPEVLDTLGEIATALNNDPNLYTTLTTMISTNIEAAKAELRGVVSSSFDTMAELEAGLTAEAAARTAADATLQSNIGTVASDLAAEATARAAADTALDGRLTTVESQAAGKIGDLTTLTTTVKTDLVSAINEVDADLAAEVAARTSADAAEATARAAGDATLQTNINAEATRAQAAEGVLQTNIDAEAARAQSAETALTSSIAAEASARQAADTTLTSNLTAEVSRAQAAEGVLQANIDTEIAARIAADDAVAAAASDQLATETTARLAGDAALDGRIDAVQGELDASQAGVGLNVDGTFTAPENTTYLGATTTVKGMSVALDSALTTEVGRAQAAEAALGSAIANEAQLRADGDAALQSQLEAWVQTQIALDNTTDEARVAAEAALRTSADAALQAELDRTQAAVGLDTDGNIIPIVGTNYLDGATSVFAGAFALDTQLKIVTDGLAAEAAARTTADANFLSQLQAETADRTAGDVALQQELNTTQAGAGLEADGTYAAPTGSNYLNLSTSLKDADYLLDAAVKVVSNAVEAEATARAAADTVQGSNLASEVTRAEAAEAALQSNIDAEAAARAAADTTLTSNLAAEVSARTAADTALQANIDAEASARAAADATLTTAVSDEAAARAAADATLQANINALSTSQSTAVADEAAARAAADQSIRDAINGGKFAFTAASASLVHTIQHNLNTSPVLVTVYVEGDDGKYRNDIVAVEETNNNTITVGLTESRKVKVAVMSLAGI